MLAATAFAAGTIGAGAQIESLPVTEDFESGTTGIFEGGEAYSNDHIGNVMKVVNSTATASFSPAYTLKENEKVTFRFTAFHGWVGGSNTAVVSINNSDGESLVSYTYGYNACNVTDVSIGGATASGFTSFFGQSNCYVSNKSANGYTHAQYFVSDEGYNPVVTMSVTNVGFVEFNLSYTQANGTAVNESYRGQLPAGTKVDLGSMTIQTAETNSDRVIGIDNLSITSEISQVSYVSYTLKKVCDGVELSSETLSAIEGSDVALSTASYFNENGKKYIYVSDDAATVGAAAEGNVYTITYREAAEYTYTLNGIDPNSEPLGVVKTGKNYEGETFDVAYPAWINVDGTIYTAGKLSTDGKGYFSQ